MVLVFEGYSGKCLNNLVGFSAVDSVLQDFGFKKMIDYSKEELILLKLVNCNDMIGKIY
jgi:hypothetical protein